jgi:hypothetical protein
MDSCSSAIGPMASCCERGNERSGREISLLAESLNKTSDP